MNVVSKLTMPVLIGGLVAMMLSGIFAPPAVARGYDVETVAQVTGVAEWDRLNVRRWPAHYSERIGQVAPRTWVWVERCIEVDRSSDWCLVERAGTRGWVNSRFLTLHWQ